MSAPLTKSHSLCLAGLLLACGCSVVRVEPGAGPSITAAVRSSAPGDASLSARTVQELYRLDLYKLYPGSMGDLAARLHADAVEASRPELLFALAEVNHVRGRQLEKEDDPRATICYFRAAGYAYHYLFGEAGVASSPEAAFDPRFRLACDLYNTALARCLVLALTWRQMDARGRWELPGRDEGDPPAKLGVAHVGFGWRAEEFGSLSLCSAHKVVGLPTVQRTHGIGVPLVGHRSPEAPARAFVAPDLSFPVTAFCRFEGGLADLLEKPRAALELINPGAARAVKIGERSVPLEMDLTTPMAYYLGQSHLEKAGYLSFLKPSILGDRAGLRFLEPYQPGKIPVVFVHGLLSSPQTFAPTINELQGDPVLRQRYRFGVYFYPTGEPYLATAADLRRDLDRYRQTVDPEGKDPALARTVLVGHSMGGLISRLLTVDGGDDFWRAASRTPLAKLDVPEAAKRELCRMYYFQRDPGVSRVVFCGTPHRGSRLSPSLIGRLAALMAGVPKQLLRTTAEAAKHNAECKLPTSVELLAPDAPALKILSERPRPAQAAYHSIVGVSLSDSLFVEGCFGGDGRAGDGVVPYESAHLEGVESELVVHADHYHVHHHPLAVRELARILHEHLKQTGEER